MPLASAQVETTLLVLKIAFLVLLYLFIWRIVRSASRDLRLPQESMILSPQQASSLLAQPVGAGAGQARRGQEPGTARGDVYAIDSSAADRRPRGENDLAIDGDEYASARHARFEPRRDGIYVEDVGSTNGTFVNGIRLTRRPAARAGRHRPDRRDRPEVRAMRALELGRPSRNTGRKRRHNEDSFVYAPPLFAVADGMGGAQAGEVASSLAAAALARERGRPGDERASSAWSS